MKIGGIDVGTTGCKLVVYDENGNFLHKEYEAYEISRNAGEHEIDGRLISDGVKRLIKNTVLHIGALDAIGVTSFGETFVLLDERDEVLCPSMLYTDPRGGEEVMAFDAERVMEIAGTKPHSMYSLPKLMWIKGNRPDIYEKTKRIMLFEDYIIYMLTGVAQIDRSLAARTMGLDIRSCDWSRELFDLAGIDISKMSRVVKSGSIAGTVKENVAKELGLSETVIVNGCHDQVASAVGAGVFEPETAVDGTGTVECITPIFDKIPTDRELYDSYYSVVPYIEDGKYACYAFSFTGGAAIKWFRDNFAAESSYKELDAQITPSCGSILVLPHFSGAATPYMDSFSKAAFLGLTLETTKADLYKAIMEGVTYEILLNLKRLNKSGITPAKFYATGGGALSPVWLQMKADILGQPITALDAPEVGAAGTVMLTGTATGTFRDLMHARSVMVKETETYLPNAKRHKEYSRIFKRYEGLYNAVRPLFDEAR